MAALNFHKRQTRRWWYAGVTLMAVAFFTVFFVGGAFAIVTGSPSNFESQDTNVPNSNPPLPDGNLTNDVSGHSDWNCFANGGSSNTTGFVTASITGGTNCSSNLVKANAVAKTDPAATTSDDSWVNGQKMDLACEKVGTNKNPPKDDFTAIASYNEVLASNKHTYLYGATLRVAPNGNASGNVELNQVAGSSSCPITRTAGDHLLAFDYLNGGANLNLHALTWIDATHSTLGGNTGTCIVKTDSMPCWGAQVITPGPDAFEGDVNQSAIASGANGISGQALVAGQFAEFGVDLTSALNQDPNACNTTSQITWESRASGSSFSSNPEDISIEKHPVSNCGQIIIRKVTSPSPDPNDTSFGYSDNIASSSDTFSLKNGGSKDFGSSVLQGSYSVTETTDPAYKLTSIDCSASTKTAGSTASGDTSTGATTISLKPGDVIDCTYTNTLNTATLSTQQSTTTTSVTPGTSVTDTATVTGSTSTTPIGTVSFFLCGPLQSASGCTSTDPTNTAAGTGTLSATQTAGQASATSSPAVNTGNGLSPGIYCFEATWPGDTKYPGALDATSATNECFTVSKINTSTVTTPNDGSGVAGAENTITLGGTIYDTAVVTGNSVGGDPTGNVVFHECGPISTGNCSTGGNLVGLLTGVALVSDGVSTTYTSSATSAGFTPSAVGRYCFRGDYGGSTVYNPSSDPSTTTATNECFTVTDTTTSSSAQTWYPNDSASVSADHQSTISGTLTLKLYTGGTCQTGMEVSGQSYTSGDQTNKSTITVDSKTAGVPQTSYGVSANATVSWKVVFTSDNTALIGNSNHCESSSIANLSN